LFIIGSRLSNLGDMLLGPAFLLAEHQKPEQRPAKRYPLICGSDPGSLPKLASGLPGKPMGVEDLPECIKILLGG
jgi:hypothetical protein